MTEILFLKHVFNRLIISVLNTLFFVFFYENQNPIYCKDCIEEAKYLSFEGW